MIVPRETVAEKLKERYGYTAAKAEQIINEYEELGKSGDLSDFAATLISGERYVQ